jgi:hypothetical protein
MNSTHQFSQLPVFIGTFRVQSKNLHTTQWGAAAYEAIERKLVGKCGDESGGVVERWAETWLHSIGA